MSAENTAKGVGATLKAIAQEMIAAESRAHVDDDTVLRLILRANRVLHDEIARREIKEP